MKQTTALRLLLLVFAALATVPAAWAFNCCRAADITGDGFVDQADIDELLERYGLPCPRRDLDGSGIVDDRDIELVKYYMNADCTKWCPADFNDDGYVDSLDRTLLLDHFGQTCADFGARQFDLNITCSVEWEDVWFLLASTGQCGSLPEPIPFPTSLHGDPRTLVLPIFSADDPDDAGPPALGGRISAALRCGRRGEPAISLGIVWS